MQDDGSKYNKVCMCWSAKKTHNGTCYTDVFAEIRIFETFFGLAIAKDLNVSKFIVLKCTLSLKCLCDCS